MVHGGRSTGRVYGVAVERLVVGGLEAIALCIYGSSRLRDEGSQKLRCRGGAEREVRSAREQT